MARLFTDGAEFGDLLFWTANTGGTVNTSSPRTGIYRYSWDRVGTYGGSKRITPSSEIYLRQALMYTSYLNAGDVGVPYWQASSGTNFGYLGINSFRQLTIYFWTGGSFSLRATGSRTLTQDQWYVVELHIKIDDSVGIVETRIDGVPDVSYSGDTRPLSDTQIDKVVWYQNAPNCFSFNLDDLALNDTNGVTDNSWCGDGRVILLKPNANGDVSQLVGQDSDSTDNYLNVDEIPTDSDTTYNQGAVSGEYDLYNLEASGLNNVSIQRGWIEARARKLKAVDDRVLLGLKTGGTEYWNDNHALMVGSYSRIIRDHKINPVSGSAWTVADLDALQVGMKVE